MKSTKKFLCLLLAAALCLSVFGCSKKPDIQALVSEANMVVAAYEPINGECYEFKSDYLEEENSYVILMRVDEVRLDEILADSNPQFTEMIRQITLNTLDENEDMISANLIALVKLVEISFEDTDITIAAGYVDQNGEVTHYY